MNISPLITCVTTKVKVKGGVYLTNPPDTGYYRRGWFPSGGFQQERKK